MYPVIARAREHQKQSRFNSGLLRRRTDVLLLAMTVASVYRNITGAFADSAILFPLLALLSTQSGFSIGLLLFSAGLIYCISGLLFKIPMPVQPLKSLVIAAITLGATFQEVRISGAVIGVCCLLAILFKLHNLANKIPLSLIHGLQAGLGVLMLSKGFLMIIPLDASFPMGTFISYSVMLGLILYFSRYSAWPLLGIVATLGLLWGLFSPSPLIPETPHSLILQPMRISVLLALVLPQLVLTGANSVIGTQYAAQKYFGEQAKKVTFKRLLASIGIGNLLSSFIGGLPFCHGAGGLTAHVKGGSTHWISNWIIGLFLIMLAAFSSRVSLHFPSFITALLLSAVGILHIELARDSWKEKSLRWQIVIMGMTALITQNMLWVLGVGLAYHFSFHAGALERDLKRGVREDLVRRKQKMKTITLRCLGPAKQFSPNGEIKLEIYCDATIRDLRARLSEWLSPHPLKTEMQAILELSVFATQNKILREEDSVQENTEFALIPPVSGG